MSVQRLVRSSGTDKQTDRQTDILLLYFKDNLKNLLNCPCNYFRFRSAREAELSEKKARDKGEELPEVNSNKIISSDYPLILLI